MLDDKVREKLVLIGWKVIRCALPSPLSPQPPRLACLAPHTCRSLRLVRWVRPLFLACLMMVVGQTLPASKFVWVAIALAMSSITLKPSRVISICLPLRNVCLLLGQTKRPLGSCFDICLLSMLLLEFHQTHVDCRLLSQGLFTRISPGLEKLTIWPEVREINV